MVKKKVIKEKKVVRKENKKVVAPKGVTREISKKISTKGKKRSKFAIINEKLNRILRREKEQAKQDRSLKRLEHEQSDDLEELEKLQKEIKKEVGDHPLTKITRKDISKAIIGAFIGVISHFSFAKGVDLANQMSMARASLFFVFSFVMGFIFIYTTGYRKIKQVKLLKMIPLRVVVIYIVALVVVFLVLTLFNKYHTLVELYKQMAVISLLAMIGASAADLIGE